MQSHPLEIELKLRLSLTLRIGLAINHQTKGRVCNSQIRAAELHPVQQIEIRHAQLRFHVFAYGELLDRRDVFIQVPRTADIEDAWRRAQRPQTRGR